ncbi:cyclin-like protein [Choiromyces venosus 120613-1]|uniref:RNA polymerase II holoenzyme cyclin-like subunit n=1 Tax=Choiromyces venosus 120613-1 TaxID=1336337 RepID=A0A3N4K6A7_9PEZI|nr:cyclin-like protein [Choiromyces venosus 120613-1]
MAANYWASSQRLHWQMSRQRLAVIRSALDAQDPKTVQQYPLPELRHLSIYFNSQIVRLGRRMQTRQQALATAQLYIRRFYTKVPIRDTNPYLVMATCLYLALKMEECPQHIRIVVSEARTCWPDVVPSDTAKLAECEFYLISEMNSYLIVHHPYRTLQDLTPVLSLNADENNTAWQVINDSCLTDLPLLYPPHIIALTAIFLSVVLKTSLPQANIHAATSSAAVAAAAVVAANSGNSGGNSGGGGVYGTSGQGPQVRIGKLIECSSPLLCLSLFSPPPFSPLSKTQTTPSPPQPSPLNSSIPLPRTTPLHIQKHTSHPSKVSIIDTVRCCIVVCLSVCYNLIIATLLHPSFPPLHLFLPCIVPPLNPQIPTSAKENKSPHSLFNSLLGQFLLAITSTFP